MSEPEKHWWLHLGQTTRILLAVGFAIFAVLNLIRHEPVIESPYAWRGWPLPYWRYMDLSSDPLYRGPSDDATHWNLVALLVDSIVAAIFVLSFAHANEWRIRRSTGMAAGRIRFSLSTFIVMILVLPNVVLKQFLEGWPFEYGGWRHIYRRDFFVLDVLLSLIGTVYIAVFCEWLIRRRNEGRKP